MDKPRETEVQATLNEPQIRINSDLQIFNENKKSLIIFEKSEKQEVTSDFWSLFEAGKALTPLRFSNGKTQEDVVQEIIEEIKKGKRIILLHGMCGTGKSAIALNIARVLGKTAVVVPVKALQRQYEEDYTSKKSVQKINGETLHIAMITGRANHDSIIKNGASCADLFLPETIALVEKNVVLLQKYYDENPLITHKHSKVFIHKLRRISVAPANPYWSPILPASFEFSQFKDSKKHRYTGLNNKDFIFYHRKRGCSYYDQYLSYLSADVIIFNAAKYKIEVSLDRKPETEADIIDEADEFLDSLSLQEELNITRLRSTLQSLYLEDEEAQDVLKSVIELISLEEKNKQALGIDENNLFPIKDTKLERMLNLFLQNRSLKSEIILDEESYAYKALEIAERFEQLLEETYVSFRRSEKDIIASFVSTNLSKKFKEISEKNKALILMSGTLHSSVVLKNVFGIEDFAVVEAETIPLGVLDIEQTGKEFDCRHANFKSGKHTREEYLRALEACLERAKRPVLVHVNAYDDLPSEEEAAQYGIKGVMTKDHLRRVQYEDKTGKRVSLFKSKMADVLYSTTCTRGVDFPGDICNSMVFTKYPNPNVQDIFWKLLKQKHPASYWSFYKDKARREFLQRLFRALRSKDDHVFVLSPDSRVLEAVKDVQKSMQSVQKI